MRVRIDGDWKEYVVRTFEKNNKIYVDDQQLQKDWSLHKMEWIEEIYIGYHYDLRCEVLFGIYRIDGMQASDILCFRP